MSQVHNDDIVDYQIIIIIIIIIINIIISFKLIQLIPHK